MTTPTMYNTKTFTQIWNNADSFVSDYKASKLYDSGNKISDGNAEVLYYLLFAKFGNNPIANWDENQFKYKVFSIIFQYGPNWERELEVQFELRKLNITELQAGSIVMFKHAYGDATSPSASDDMSYTNDKNEQKTTRAKVDGYALLLSLLKEDITDKFLNKFKVCFKMVVYPEHPMLFETDVDDDEII